MTKSSVTKKAVKAIKAKTTTKQPMPALYGPVSKISTAPVAIGNSIKGVSPIITTTSRGVVVRGRDYFFGAIGTGNVTTWTVCGGSPLTPSVFADSSLRQYMQMYARFKFRRVILHYITSSPTSSNGDIMFYYQKDRTSVFLNQTSTQLLPFVLSDSNTVIGPQWTNHMAEIEPSQVWLSTDYGQDTSTFEHYADGDVFLLSKTSTTDSPGYVLLDYEVEFDQQQIQPRLLSLPISRGQWWQTCIGQTTSVVTTGTQVGPYLQNNNISGVSASLPPGISNGDVYKVIIDLTNSNSAGWVGMTTTVRSGESGGYAAITIQDGTTLYAVFNGSLFEMYASPTAAVSGGQGIYYNVNATVTYNWQVWISYLGSIGSVNLNPNF